MTERTEPVRWLDSTASEDVPVRLRELLLAEQQADSSGVSPADAARLARVLQRVADEVARPELCQAARAQPDSARSMPGRRLGMFGKSLVGLAALAIGAFGWLLGRPRIAATRVPATSPIYAPAQPPVVPAAAAAAGGPAIDAVPEPAGAATPTATRAHAHALRVVIDPVQELALLEQAQRAVHRDPQHALTLLSQHELIFAKGQFVQEREMLAIEALQALGRSQAAQRRGRSFMQHFPQSSHAPRLQQLLRSTDR